MSQPRLTPVAFTARAAARLIVIVGASALTGAEFRAPVRANQTQQVPLTADMTEEQKARAVCGTCHAFPPPEILPKNVSRRQIFS